MDKIEMMIGAAILCMGAALGLALATVMNEPVAQVSVTTAKCTAWIDESGTRECPVDWKQKRYSLEWVK